MAKVFSLTAAHICWLTLASQAAINAVWYIPACSRILHPNKTSPFWLLLGWQVFIEQMHCFCHCASHCTAIALPMQVLVHCASAHSSKNNFPLHLPMSLLHSRKCNSSKSLFLSSNTFFFKSFLNVFLQEQSTYCKMSLRALFTFDVTLSMLVGLEKGCNANWTCPLTNISFSPKIET